MQNPRQVKLFTVFPGPQRPMQILYSHIPTYVYVLCIYITY